MDFPSLDWRKSTRSGQEGGTCVEVAVLGHDNRSDA
ncbi:DUF397 domain-containing protein [Actinoallomurus acanthiterrae]